MDSKPLLFLALLAMTLSAPASAGRLGALAGAPFGLPDAAPPSDVPDVVPPFDLPGVAPPVDPAGTIPPSPPGGGTAISLGPPEGVPPVSVPEPPTGRPDPTPPFGLPEGAPPTGAPPSDLPDSAPPVEIPDVRVVPPGPIFDVDRAVTFERDGEDIWISVHHPRLGEIDGLGDPFLTVHVTPGSGEPPTIEGPFVPSPDHPDQSGNPAPEAVRTASEGRALLTAAVPLSAVPEPSVALLLGTGAVFLALSRRGR